MEDNYYVYKGRRIRKFDEVDTKDGVIAVETDQWKRIKKLIRLERKLEESGIPLRTLEYTMESYVHSGDSTIPERMTKFINEFDSRYRSVHLYLYGPNSTQKTSTASIVGKELIEQGFQVKFILMNNLVRLLQQQDFNKDNTTLSDAMNCDFLIVDDAFDPAKVTLYKSGYQIPSLDAFLRERLEVYSRSTCFTSNIPVSKIGDSFGESIQALIERSVKGVLHMTDKYSMKDDFDPEALWR